MKMKPYLNEKSEENESDSRKDEAKKHDRG